MRSALYLALITALGCGGNNDPEDECQNTGDCYSRDAGYDAVESDGRGICKTNCNSDLGNDLEGRLDSGRDLGNDAYDGGLENDLGSDAYDAGNQAPVLVLPPINPKVGDYVAGDGQNVYQFTRFVSRCLDLSGGNTADVAEFRFYPNLVTQPADYVSYTGTEVCTTYPSAGLRDAKIQAIGSVEELLDEDYFHTNTSE